MEERIGTLFLITIASCGFLEEDGNGSAGKSGGFSTAAA
jgi:hypothetical protein